MQILMSFLVALTHALQDLKSSKSFLGNLGPINWMTFCLTKCGEELEFLHPVVVN